MPRRRRYLLSPWVCLLLLACTAGGPGTSVAPTDGANPSTSIDTASVIVAWNSPPDELYLPLLMAISAMQEQGYNIEGRQLPETNLVIQALTSNQVQFAAEGVPTGSLAIQEGAPIQIISTQNSNQVVWATLPEFEDCSTMEGQPVGTYGLDSGFTVLATIYLDRTCPGTHETFDWIIIQDSALRAQALAEGQISATDLGLPDALALQRDYPDEFNYVYLAQALPGIGDEHVYTNTETIESHPDIVRALVREQLLAQRFLYEHPGQAMEQVELHLPDVETDSVIQEFIEQRIWYANGGLGGPGLENTLEALDLTGDADEMAAGEVLEDVLAEIGESDLTEH